MDYHFQIKQPKLIFNHYHIFLYWDYFKELYYTHLRLSLILTENIGLTYNSIIIVKWIKFKQNLVQTCIIYPIRERNFSAKTNP